MQTSPWRKEPLSFLSPQGRSHPYSKLCRWEIIFQAKLFTPWLQLRGGQGVLLPLVSSPDLPQQDSGLQDFGEVLLPSRSEGCGQTQAGRAVQPLPLGESWPLPPPLAALSSPQRWGRLLSCRKACILQQDAKQGNKSSSLALQVKTINSAHPASQLKVQLPFVGVQHLQLEVRQTTGQPSASGQPQHLSQAHAKEASHMTQRECSIFCRVITLSKMWAPEVKDMSYIVGQ